MHIYARLHDLDIRVHQEMVYCKHCSEAWFSVKPANAERVGNFYVVERCAVCTRSRGTAGTAPHAQRFSKQNGMHPQPPPSHLLPLTEIEETLIALHAPVLRVFRLRGGQLGYGGSCVSLTQDVGAVARSLPRRMEGLDVVIFSKSVAASEEGGEAVRKTFRVRRSVVNAWLEFLTKNNPLYSHVHIERDSLDALPEDSFDSLEHMPMRHEADVEPMLTDSGKLIPSGEIDHIVIDGLAIVSKESEDVLKQRHILEWPAQSENSVREFGHPG